MYDYINLKKNTLQTYIIKQKDKKAKRYTGNINSGNFSSLVVIAREYILYI